MKWLILKGIQESTAVCLQLLRIFLFLSAMGPGNPLLAGQSDPEVEAENTVRCFFDDWRNGHIDDMYAKIWDGRHPVSGDLIGHTPPADLFHSALDNSPVSFRNLRIVASNEITGVVEVVFSLEVTDMSSLIGAFLFSEDVYWASHAMSPDGGHTRAAQWITFTPPRAIGIETFETRMEKWELWETDGRWKVAAVDEKAAPLIFYLLVANPMTEPVRDYLIAKSTSAANNETAAAYYAVLLRRFSGVPANKLKDNIWPAARDKRDKAWGQFFPRTGP